MTSNDTTTTSDKGIRGLKERKPNNWSKEAWDNARAALNTPEQLKDPRTHPIILAGPLGTPEKIQEVAGLSHSPTIEQTTTISAEDQGTVRFCRVNDSGLFKVKDYAELERILVSFDGKERYAWTGIRRKS